MTAKALIVGNGPTHSNISFIKNFDATIICCDITARNMVESGIIPKYVTFSETREGLEETTLNFLPDSFLDYYITVVHRNSCSAIIDDRTEALHLKTLIFDVQSYVNNVGLYSIIFAIQHLGIRELHLIGMEHRGEKWPESVYENWVKTFTKYLSTKPDCKIIDHSNGMITELLTSIS